MVNNFDIRYDRRVSDDFLQLFLGDNVLSRLRVIAQQAALPLDLQMRKSPGTGAEWASLYVGLTSVLDVHRVKDGLRFKAHKTWSENRAYGFHLCWKNPMTPTEVADAWDDIELYLERVIPAAVRGHAMTEGVVQTATSKSVTSEWAFLDREVTPSFRDQAYKTEVLEKCMAPLIELGAQAKTLLGKVPAGPKKYGAECDLLALDRNGRILAIEVKPLGASTIAWVPAQAAMYARVLQRWVTSDSHARDILKETLFQRQALGHCVGFNAALPDFLQVTPVVVLQKGAAQVKRGQMLKVLDLLTERLSDTPPVEIYEVSILGDITPLQ